MGKNTNTKKPKRLLKIVHVVAEINPFFRSGGLGIVVPSLANAQRDLGHEVAIVAPYYGSLIPKSLKRQLQLKLVGTENIEFKNGGESGVIEPVEFYKSIQDNGVVLYFISHKKFFLRQKSIYGRRNDNARFYLFDLAVLTLLQKINQQPDILHCHDWHAGLIPFFLRTRFKNVLFWDNVTTVFTIHNLAYQFGHNWIHVDSLRRDDGRTALPLPSDTKKMEVVNFSKRAILNADIINTVSETYREEILTRDFGEELHRILKGRQKILFGIINGIDYQEYNPLTDQGIRQHYSDKSIERKTANKSWLQKHFKFDVNPNIPVVVMTSRIVEQKGYHLLKDAIESLLTHDIQFIIMGDGNKEIIDFFKQVQTKHPTSFVITPFEQKYETSTYAGGDLFLLPSRFEPCGINQMIALRYGCIPVVHHIGGLVDTIRDYDPRTGEGNGFVFKKYNPESMVVAVARAVENFKHQDSWKELILTGMQEANSWLLPAKTYIDLYYKGIWLHKKFYKEKYGKG